MKGFIIETPWLRTCWRLVCWSKCYVEMFHLRQWALNDAYGLSFNLGLWFLVLEVNPDSNWYQPVHPLRGLFPAWYMEIQNASHTFSTPKPCPFCLPALGPWSCPSLKVKLVGAGSELAVNQSSSTGITNPYEYSQACLAKSGVTGLGP